MNVLQVVASINREVGGPAVTVPRLASALSALGAATTLATLDYARLGPQPALHGVRLKSLPAGRLARGLRGWSPRFSAKVMRLAEAADVVHNHGLWMFPNLYARRAAQNGRVPLVLSPRGMLDEWSLRRSPLRKSVAWRLFERENLDSARLFHATSAAEALAIRAVRLEQPIAVIPNGVDVPEQAGLAERAVLERDFPALRGKRWLLFLSRLHPKKGIAELLRAWRSLGATAAGWHLVLAGPDLDGHGASLRRLAAELGLEDRVAFTGMLSGAAKTSALANAELLVLPTHSENFGLVVAEALAHGTPVITTRATPWRELEASSSGWWIEDLPEALQAALETALRLAPQALRDMGARGRALVLEKYSWDRVGRDMLAAYRWIREGGQRPDFVQ